MVQHRSRCQRCNCTDRGNPPILLSTRSSPKNVFSFTSLAKPDYSYKQDVHLLLGINKWFTFLSKISFVSDSQIDLQEDNSLHVCSFSEWRYMTLSWMWRKVVSAMIFWKYQAAVWLILRIAEVLASKNSKLTPIMPWYTFTQAPTVSHNEAFSFILKVCVTQSSMIATNRKTFQWNSSEY